MAAAPPLPPPPAVLDLDHVRATFGALDAGAAAMLAFFLETTGPTLAQARAALAASDLDAARAAAHSAAGAARTAGAVELAGHCVALESALVAGRRAEADAHAAALEPAFRAVTAAVAALGRSVASSP